MKPGRDDMLHVYSREFGESYKVIVTYFVNSQKVLQYFLSKQNVFMFMVLLWNGQALIVTIR